MCTLSKKIFVDLFACSLLVALTAWKSCFASTPNLTAHRTWTQDREPIRTDDRRVNYLAPIWKFEGRPYSGLLIKHNPDKSWTQMEIKDGMMNGLVVTRLGQRQKISEGHYQSGMPEGEHRNWWASGTLQSLTHYAGGAPHGAMQSWYENGSVFEERNYVRGQESGLQRVWSKERLLRANYVIKDGRRFGSMGSRSCPGGTAAQADLRLGLDALKQGTPP